MEVTTMADVEMSDSVPCKFDEKGWSPCKKPSTNGWCSKHEKLKCCSCGKKAVKSCDTGMGGLLCGVPLCSDCEHDQDSGDHVIKEVADENRRKEKEEKEARVASRDSSVQRMNEELGVPATLFELLKGDWRAEGYELKKVYFLHLKHGLMGFFPAIFSSDESRIIFTTDLNLLEKVWQTLKFKRASLEENLAYVNEKHGIVYLEASYPEERERREPEKLLTIEEFENLEKENEMEKVFRWAFGLMGSGLISQDSFQKDLVKQAVTLKPTFKSEFV